jgi:hypothetical protein
MLNWLSTTESMIMATPKNQKCSVKIEDIRKATEQFVGYWEPLVKKGKGKMVDEKQEAAEEKNQGFFDKVAGAGKNLFSKLSSPFSSSSQEKK